MEECRFVTDYHGELACKVHEDRPNGPAFCTVAARALQDRVRKLELYVGKADEENEALQQRVEEADKVYEKGCEIIAFLEAANARLREALFKSIINERHEDRAMGRAVRHELLPSGLPCPCVRCAALSPDAGRAEARPQE